MSLIVLAIVGASVGASAAIGRLMWRVRARRRSPEGGAGALPGAAAGARAAPASRGSGAPNGSVAPSTGPAGTPAQDGDSRYGALDPRLFATLPLKPGDVLDVEGESRWLGAAILLCDTTGVRCSLFSMPEEEPTKLVVAFPPPSHEVLWLERLALTLPPGAPSFLDCGAAVVELRASYPVELAASSPSFALGTSGKVSLYEGAGDNAALLLRSDAGTALWFGRRIAAGAYEVVGNVAREPGEG